MSDVKIATSISSLDDSGNNSPKKSSGARTSTESGSASKTTARRKSLEASFLNESSFLIHEAANNEEDEQVTRENKTFGCVSLPAQLKQKQYGIKIEKTKESQQLSVDNIDLEYLKINHSDVQSLVEKRDSLALKDQNVRIELLEQKIEVLSKQCLHYQRIINSLSASKKSKKKTSP
jgi:hypothetical protein